MAAFDTPGIFSIFSTNEDAQISRNILLFAETQEDIQGILLVADAKNLKRSIAIALQYAEYGLPMLFDVNMIDESAARGIEIDCEKLSEILGVEVCTSVARDGIGTQEIISKLHHLRSLRKLFTYPSKVEEYLKITEKLLESSAVAPRAVGLLLLVEDIAAEEYVKNNFGAAMLEQLKDLAAEYSKNERLPINILLTNLYNQQAEKVVRQVQKTEPPSKSPFIMTFGDLCTQIQTGFPIAFIVLALLYLFVGSFGATYLVDTINATVFQGFLIPLTEKVVAPIPSAFIRDMIIDPEFGMLPTGVFLALGLVLPVLFCFYIAFGFLEDSGYLSRLSILLNKLFKKMGLNGKGVIPLVMGYSCVTMAILTTRMLDTKKERNIATLLLLLGTPCAPLLAVMFIILDKMPLSATLTVYGIIFTQIFMAGWLLDKVLPGRSSPLLMEIPPMRVPKPLQVLKMATLKTFHFMKEAVPIFMLASLAVFLFDRMGGLTIMEKAAHPLVSGLMGLPEKSVQVFIKTIIRRESGATELLHLSSVYSNAQMVINLLVMTFLSPCINAIIVVFKERGVPTALAMLATVMIYALTVGSILHFLFRSLEITFT